MVQESPKIDHRTAGDVEAELQQALLKLRDRNPDWANFDPGAGLSRAMVGIFSRLTEIVIRRLNGVPEKNFLAFLDLLGAAPLPPQPARVPLTFTLAAGVVTEAVVRPGTQVAAPPAEGEKEPTIYETERELVVTAARLDSVFCANPTRTGTLIAMFSSTLPCLQVSQSSRATSASSTSSTSGTTPFSVCPR